MFRVRVWVRVAPCSTLLHCSVVARHIVVQVPCPVSVVAVEAGDMDVILHEGDLRVRRG